MKNLRPALGPFIRMLPSALFSAVLFLLLAGCGENKPPEPVAPEDAPAALREAFTSAQPATKDLVEQVAGAIEKGDLAKASVGLNSLSANQTITKEQRSLAARCLISVNEKIQQAAAQGDQQAQQFRHIQRGAK